MPVVKKNAKPQIIHLDDDVEQGITPESEKDDARLALDPRITVRTIEIVSLDILSPNPRNARKHDAHQVSAIANSIDRFGFRIPITVDEQYQIQSGHGRWLAARQLGMQHVPVVRETHLNAAEKRAAAIADNKLAELSQWDYDILGEDFTFFDDPENDLGFDARITGFDTAEIDQIIEGVEDPQVQDRADAVVLPDSKAVAVSQRGDVWICGRHLLLCGDALNGADYATIMGHDRAQIVFTDAPYNVSNKGHVTKRDGVREFDMARGEMSSDEFTEFLFTTSSHLLTYMAQGAVAYLCMDWRHMSELRAAAGRVFGPQKNLIVWVKHNAGMGSFYRSQHELIFVYCAPGKPINNFGLGAKGRHRTNVWTYQGLTSFGRDRDETLRMHPTVKPVAMVKDALMDCSNRGDLVLDPFGGSGTTMIAAERSGRRARLIEIDPLYCDTIVERWQTFTGKEARLAGTEETFAVVKTLRASGHNTGG